jgi:hypothetical protein
VKKSVPKSMAEQRVMRKYDKLYVPLVELAHALQDLEPGGTTVSDAEFTVRDGTVHMEYKAHPVMVTIVEGGRKLSLRMDEVHQDV